MKRANVGVGASDTNPRGIFEESPNGGGICDAVTSILDFRLSSRDRTHPPAHPFNFSALLVFWCVGPSPIVCSVFLLLGFCSRGFEMAIGKSEKVAIAIGFVGAAFTLMAYEQTMMTTTHSILVGFAISLVALAIKEFDLMS